MPPAYSQFAPPTDPADPPPCTPSGPATHTSYAVPGEPIKPASKTTRILGGARKLFVRSRTDKGRARSAPRATGQEGLRAPPALFKTAAASSEASAVSNLYQASPLSARLMARLMGGQQLHSNFLESGSETCTPSKQLAVSVSPLAQ